MQQIVFDFDGPLFDGRKAAQSALEQTFNQFESRFGRPQLSFATVPLFGPRTLVSMFYHDLERSAREEIRIYYQTKLHAAERLLGVEPSVHSTLQKLRQLGCPLAVFSARKEDELRSLMDHLGLLKYFTAIGGKPSYHKPDGAFLRYLAQEAGSSTESILFIGDSELDYLAAESAGALYYHAAWSGEPVSLAIRKAGAVLGCLRDLVSIIDASAQPIGGMEGDDWREAVGNGHFAFYAGAGISIPSGVGGWEEHYRPILSALSASYLENGTDLPEALQLLAATPTRARKVFDAFSDSFMLKGATPNSFHFAMLRSGAEHVWTSNYDSLLESANTLGRFDRRIVRRDSELLASFRDPRLIVKMNGDFCSAHFRDDLDWGLVFLQEQFDRGESERPEIWRLFEDDYRQRSIVFVGVSFRDPILRRILAVARQRIPRTRYNHFLLVKREVDPIAKIKQSLFAENLRRSCIITIFKDSYAEIAEFVQRVALAAYRPIIGFSGDVGRIPTGVNEAGFKGMVPQGLTTTVDEIARICSALGTQLARKGYRITSGCAPFVGIPFVDAAFAVDPTLARFYLRRQGGSRYRGSAAAVVVPGDDYSSMRARFIPELSVLVAIGGIAVAGEKSGTIAEIEMALDRGLPVILLKPAGGDVEEHYDRLRTRMLTAYGDECLRNLVLAINDDVAGIPVARLHDFARDTLPELIEKAMSQLMGTGTAIDRSDDAGGW